MIRLVVTALVGVAAAAAAVLLINDVRSTRGSKKTEQTKDIQTYIEVLIVQMKISVFQVFSDC